MAGLRGRFPKQNIAKLITTTQQLADQGETAAAIAGSLPTGIMNDAKISEVLIKTKPELIKFCPEDNQYEYILNLVDQNKIDDIMRVLPEMGFDTRLSLGWRKSLGFAPELVKCLPEGSNSDELKRDNDFIIEQCTQNPVFVENLSLERQKELMSRLINENGNVLVWTGIPFTEMTNEQVITALQTGGEVMEWICDIYDRCSVLKQRPAFFTECFDVFIEKFPENIEKIHKLLFDFSYIIEDLHGGKEAEYFNQLPGEYKTDLALIRKLCSVVPRVFKTQNSEILDLVVKAFEDEGKLVELQGVLMTMVAIDQLQHASSQGTAQQNFQSPIDLLPDKLKKVFYGF